jgi:hypothetical protein
VVPSFSSGGVWRASVAPVDEMKKLRGCAGRRCDGGFCVSVGVDECLRVRSRRRYLGWRRRRRRMVRGSDVVR